MRFYSVHLRRHGLDPYRDFLLIREGFSWAAFLAGGFWALWHRLWLVAVVLLLVWAGIEFVMAYLGVTLAAQATVGLAFAVGAGMLGNDFRRRRAVMDGFIEVGVVAARDRDAAETRFLDTRPDLVRAMVI
jgi:hypothetical protein